MLRNHVTNFVQEASPKVKVLKFKLLTVFFLSDWETILGLEKLSPEEIYHQPHNILRLFDALPSFSFTTNEMVCDNYL